MTEKIIQIAYGESFDQADDEVTCGLIVLTSNGRLLMNDGPLGTDTEWVEINLPKLN